MGGTSTFARWQCTCARLHKQLGNQFCHKNFSAASTFSAGEFKQGYSLELATLSGVLSLNLS